ncbi:polymorphic toxin-type HINT domain-containing protein [Anthocerotibacter panamensis]|uniref:polymorphic toxin-type HINT domain-containing protein n=1 Tax=Anthocerotibacter panamensis TaxID=2857077 RepID=UPI001C404213|nr:polymorphic toxin-type HINT domain-containing protein [Anthocerotibacter panamensis]
MQTFATPNDSLYDLELISPDAKRETLGVTGNHPFWVQNKGWTESDLLKPGMQVAGKDGSWLTVGKLMPRVERATGYNLEVEGDHSYFVGDSGAWVHNQCSRTFLVGPAGVASELGVTTPSGFRLTFDASARLAERLKGQLGLSELDGIIGNPNALRFLDSRKPNTIRIFDTSVSRFGGDGINVIINPQTNSVVTVFASNARFISQNRFTRIVP